MSPTSSMQDSTNNSAMYERNSSHEAEIGRDGVSYCTQSGASVAKTRLVEAIGAFEGGISIKVEANIIGVFGGRISFGNGGTIGSPYAFQRAIQMS